MKNKKTKNGILMILKSIVNKIFSRTALVIVLILVQFAFMGWAIYSLGNYSELTSIIFRIIAGLVALMVVYKESNPVYAIGWILIIAVMPIVGAASYVTFGNQRTSKKLKLHIEPVEKEHRKDLKQKDDIGEITGERLLDTIKYIGNYGPYPPWSGSKTNYYPMADEAFENMVKDLKNAKSFIFLEYFIIGTGYMWETIYNILKEKVKEGVDVRVIYDDIGCINKIPHSFRKDLRKNRIKVFAFNPLRPIASLIYNNRDHRKICIIDGYIGYNGGFNISDEYINKVEHFGKWKDTGVRIEGQAVWNYTVMFLEMWNAFEPTEEDFSKFRPEVNHKEPFDSDGVVQPYADSPIDNEHVAETVYREIINEASDYVYLTTPYLILDNAMISCLQIAAKRGVDIRIITPGIPDKKLVFRLTRSYYRPLLEAGVKIYEYTPGFIHAKSIVSDDIKGIVGTVNFDYRSLFLHFECATFMIGSKSVYELKNDIIDTTKISREITIADCKTSILGQILDAFLRTVAPLC